MYSNILRVLLWDHSVTQFFNGWRWIQAHCTADLTAFDCLIDQCLHSHVVMHICVHNTLCISCIFIIPSRSLLLSGCLVCSCLVFVLDFAPGDWLVVWLHVSLAVIISIDHLPLHGAWTLLHSYLDLPAHVVW